MWDFARIMQTNLPDTDLDEVEIVSLALPLDRATVAWLGKISVDDRDAAEKVACMLRMIREDDDYAHRSLH
jgi:hypothetical protein